MTFGPTLLAGPRRLSRSRSGVALVVGAALLVALGACGDDDDEVPAAADATSTVPVSSASTAPGTSGSTVPGTSASTLTGTSWTLASASIDGEDVAAVETPTLDFGADGAALAGSTGCNQFSGTYTQSGGDLTISLGPVTLAACADPGATAQEAAILAHLPEVASYAAHGQLVLKDTDGATLLTYDEGMSTIEGTSWTATGVNNGRDAVESTAVTESVTADFGRDGALSGFAGCNTYNATYALSGDDGISITNIATTRMACEDEAMTLETQYVTALGNATTYTISGETLTLRDSTDSTQVTYTLAK